MKALLILLPLGFLLSSCDINRNGYTIEDGEVLYWYPSGPGNVSRPVPAEAATFVIVESVDENHFGKDKDQVFMNGQVLHGVDPATFEYLGGLYFRDKNHGYYHYGAKCSDDPANFAVVPAPPGQLIRFAKDSRHVYSGARILENADPATFEPMVNGWKDKSGEHVW